MYIMYMLCFCTLCAYATCERPEFYANKDMFCSGLTSKKHIDKHVKNLPYHIMGSISWYYQIYVIH